MRSRALIAGLGLALVVAACGEVADETTSTSTGATTTTTTLEGLPKVDPNWQCFYLRGFVAIQPSAGMTTDDAEAAAIAALDGLGGPLSTAASAVDILNDDDAPPDLTDPGGIVDRIDSVLGLVSTPIDPLQAAMYLQSQTPSIVASPIHAVAPAGHWLFKPGTDPVPVPGSLPQVDNGTGKYVAVVDSGFVPGGPDWISGENVLYEPFDVEKNFGVASHGTFISGLIRQVAPDNRISMARVPLRPTDDFISRNHANPGTPLATEMHVFEAVVRLIIRHEATPSDVAALNMSLGTYACDPSTDALLVTLVAALNLWDTSIGAQSLAAGGNEDTVTPFWPSGLPNVRGVGAVNEAGDQIVWSNNQEVTPAPTRDWIDDYAPGANLVGLAGTGSTSESELVCWSGSSFATAVASAQFAQSITPAAKSYSAVPGLTYVAASGNAIVTVGGETVAVQQGCGPQG